MYTTLIPPSELATLAPQEVLIVDCRSNLRDPDAALAAYRKAHIPGAIHARLDQDLSDLSLQSRGLGRHPLPSADSLSRCLARWGYRPGMQVVAYDAANGALAAAR